LGKINVAPGEHCKKYCEVADQKVLQEEKGSPNQLNETTVSAEEQKFEFQRKEGRKGRHHLLDWNWTQPNA